MVGAALVRDGRLLAAQRAAPPRLRGRWELPGGKVDPGERDEDALVRECREELGVEVRLTARVGGDWPLSSGVVMRVWLAEVTAGAPKPLEHMSLRWLTSEELFDVDWLPADVPIVTALSAHLDGPSHGPSHGP